MSEREIFDRFRRNFKIATLPFSRHYFLAPFPLMFFYRMKFTIPALMATMAVISVLLAPQSGAAEDIFRDGWNDLNKNGTKDFYEDPSAAIEDRVADLLSQMTVEEKTCQFGTIYGYKRILMEIHPQPEWKDRVWVDGVGNIDEHANGRNGVKPLIPFDEHAELMNEIQRWFIENGRLGIPADFTNEGIRGISYQSASNFPNQTAIGATWDLDLVRRIGEITGREGKAVGYTNVYSPILDTIRDPRWGRAVECYSEDPFLVGEMGKAQVNGIQSESMASTVKHFAAYSSPMGGRDGECRTDPQVPMRDMHEILLAPFRKVFMETDVMGTMSSYNSYDAVPVSGSKYFLTDLLREQYGFKGYVVSDSGAVNRLQELHNVTDEFEDAVAMAVNAGLNVRTNFKTMEDFVFPLRECIKKGKVSMDTIDSRVSDVLRVKFKLGLFDEPFVDPAAAGAIVHCAEHEAATLEAARKSIVLVKNDDNALPLDENASKTVLVVGPSADDISPMMSNYGPGKSDVITPLAGIRARLGDGTKVLYAQGATHRDARFPKSDVLPEPPNEKEQQLLDEAIEKAKMADSIIVVVGDDTRTVGEAHSRTSLNLSGHQGLLVREMVRSGKPVTVVLMIGRATSINWIEENVPGVLICWFGGEKVGQAVAEALYGDINPGGKLPITFPRTVGQIPMATPYRVGAWNGQKNSRDPNGWGRSRVVDALYYFGYGLSYTSFEYSDLEISTNQLNINDELVVSCKITNTGDREGDEIVQLYLKDRVASVSPYEQVLRGFERVSLEAGESKRVEFTITPQRDLEIYDINGQWTVEPGMFDVLVGASSVDIKLRDEFEFVDADE